ncbi:PadR family transcriptional regulator [Clostridium sartagoforme]|uniref:PadR family transcriptional regulator n=1 Tax=Clostridium sartagoforme TaxID=84031 RepID=A0A4S2DFX3_9CLOT|nr:MULTISPECIES: PadR family transcriptional regulator [Clostridium]MBS5938699.1 helix-turn-helix transcriptional regulator [Clostridium sp.]TGY40927.1 PadR family transcriptional regulator [Clostridium sartagoforme]
MDKELLKGFIDILILALLTKEDMYTYEISKVIMENSNGEITLGEGTLYPALKRFYSNGYVEYYWVEKDNNLVKRKYYKITDQGREYLNSKVNDFKRLTLLVNKFL